MDGSAQIRTLFGFVNLYELLDAPLQSFTFSACSLLIEMGCIQIRIHIQTGWIRIRGKRGGFRFGLKGEGVDSDSRCLDSHITGIHFLNEYNARGCDKCLFIMLRGSSGIHLTHMSQVTQIRYLSFDQDLLKV